MPIPRVAIHIPFISAYCRQVLRGIADYAHTSVPWRFVGSPVYARQSGVMPPLHDCDGIITHAADPRDIDWYRSLDLPVVNVSGISPDHLLPRVCVDDQAIGRTGAEHLLDLGLRHLAYVEPGTGPAFIDRRQGFIQRAREVDAEVSTMAVPGRWFEGCWIDEDSAQLLHRFLDDIPRPIGLMAPHDALAIHVIAVCQTINIRVPEDIAILGVGNDELVCDFAHPSLTSIDVNARQIGYEAAKLLNHFLQGRPPDADTHRLPPHDVVARESTEMIAVEDAVIAQAVRFIRAHACKGISVSDVVSEIPLARRAFERRFLQQMKRTPLKEIRRIQIESARFLLERTDLPVAAVARRTGFRDAKYFAKAFRHETSLSPQTYRRQFATPGHRSAAKTMK